MRLARSPGGFVASRIVAIAVVVWLIIGAVAAWQRHYFDTKRELTCARTATIAVTVIAGPLNYLGVNPKVGCHVPQPSK